jgi:hypothetical protein
MGQAYVKIKAARCKHDKKKEDVFIFIGADANHTIYARAEEHVPNEVNFFAGSPCTLYFETQTRVFSKDHYRLRLGSNWLTPKRQGRTAYSINQRPHSGPVIVVP